MTAKESRILWLDFQRRRIWQVKKWRGKVYKVLKSQVTAAAEAYPKGFMRLDDIVKPGQLGKVVYDMTIDIGVREANAAYYEVTRMTKRASIGFDRAFAEEIIKYLEENFLISITNMDEYTKDLILDAITQGVRRGAGTSEIVKSIMGLTKISYSRAETITRTEFVKAANIGRMIGAKKTGLLMKKVWSSAPNNDRTRGKPKDRADHIHMNLQEVLMDDPFIDPRNGAKLMQPGDPDAPLENIIRCRCAVAFRPQKDAAGRYIRISKPLYETVSN